MLTCVYHCVLVRIRVCFLSFPAQFCTLNKPKQLKLNENGCEYVCTCQKKDIWRWSDVHTHLCICTYEQNQILNYTHHVKYPDCLYYKNSNLKKHTPNILLTIIEPYRCFGLISLDILDCVLQNSRPSLFAYVHKLWTVQANSDFPVVLSEE